MRDRWPSQNKLLIEDVALVLKLWRAGWTQIKLARMFGVSQEHISMICQGLRRQKAVKAHAE